jgi:YD repeat-containing protein
LRSGSRGPKINLGVRATRINHVSVHATDLEASARFYEEVFGMERIPAPKFRHPVIWLRLGEQQLHLFQRDAEAPAYHHLGLDVDDFEAVYRKARELGAFDPGSWYSHIYEHPAGWVQMYIRDPAGNLVEIDWPDVTTLNRSVVTDIRKLDDDVRQTGGSVDATLYTAAAVR